MGPILVSDVIPRAGGSQEPELLLNLFLDQHDVLYNPFQILLPAKEQQEIGV